MNPHYYFMLSTCTERKKLVVGRFGEFSKDFIIKLRDYIARQKAYAYVEHFNSSVISATSMFKLSITSRMALMAARG